MLISLMPRNVVGNAFWQGILVCVHRFRHDFYRFQRTSGYFEDTYPMTGNNFLRAWYTLASANSVKNCNAFFSNPL